MEQEEDGGGGGDDDKQGEEREGERVCKKWRRQREERNGMKGGRDGELSTK